MGAAPWNDLSTDGKTPAELSTIHRDRGAYSKCRLHRALGSGIAPIAGTWRRYAREL